MMHDYQQLSMRPAGRKLREKGPVDQRIAGALDDIATVLEAIAMELQRKA